MTDEVKRISYGSMDGSPSLLVVFTDGRVYGYAGDAKGGEMREASAPKVATTASVMSKEAFEKTFPNTILPTKY